MPRRKVILANGEIYHIFSRSPRRIPIFTNKKEFDLFLAATAYYLQTKPPVKFSRYKEQPNKYELDFSDPLVKITAYCLMSNHYHFILTQLKQKGITAYIHRLATSYSHFFNLKHQQKGPVFESKFKAVRVETQEQLIHLSRYVHLNPVTSCLVEKPEEYNYSSYKNYLGTEQSHFVDPADVMVDFSSPKIYEEFVLSRKNYQRELAVIKHLLLE